MISPTIHDLGERLGLVFQDPRVIGQAFVHASYANENPHLVDGNNERLEFLGDAVLGLIVSRILYERFPEADEGGLTAHRASIVNRTSLASLAEELGLDRHLRLGRGELETGGAQRPLSAAAFEALVGAVYLSDGLDAAERAFQPLLSGRLVSAAQADALKSAKSRLQEWSQRHRGGTRPMYELVSARGPAHAQQFTVAVVVGSDRLATGSGSSRQRAEEHAAQAALDHVAEVGA